MLEGNSTRRCKSGILLRRSRLQRDSKGHPYSEGVRDWAQRESTPKEYTLATIGVDSRRLLWSSLLMVYSFGVDLCDLLLVR